MCFGLAPFFYSVRATSLIGPAVIISRNASQNDLWEDMPVVARDNKNPSKLHETVNFPALIPSIAFLATSYVFIEPEDAAIMIVTSASGLLFCSVRWKQGKSNKNPYHHQELHNIKFNELRIIRFYFTLSNCLLRDCHHSVLHTSQLFRASNLVKKNKLKDYKVDRVYNDSDQIRAQVWSHNNNQRSTIVSCLHISQPYSTAFM